jgi:hypothetical protein
LLYLVEKSFYKKKNKNMENKIEWEKLGPHYKRKFIIPVGRRKRWWEFWKKDESKKAIEELMSQYKQELILGEDGDIFIPSNDSK